MKITTTAELKATTETLTENGYDMRRALAHFIYRFAPAGLSAEMLETLRLARIADADSYDSTLFLEFRRNDVGAQISVAYSAAVGRVEDAAGSLFRIYGFKVNVTFPGYGATAPMLALQRLALMQEVTVFALMLEREFTAPVYKLVATKAEREEAALNELRRANVEKVRACITTTGATLKGMRVGDERAFFVESDVPEGNYELTTGKYSFRVAVDRVRGSCEELRLIVHRTA